ncbi:MAG: hypothetical protein AAF488_03430 [Planctomycetota bacterium]
MNDASSQGSIYDPEAGLTIVEIVIATVIIAITAAGVLSSISMAYIADRSSQDLITAQNLSRGVMESVEVTPFEGLLSLDGATLTDGRFQALTNVTLVSVGLNRVEVLVTCSDNADINLRTVTLVSDRS